MKTSTLKTGSQFDFVPKCWGYEWCLLSGINGHFSKKLILLEPHDQEIGGRTCFQPPTSYLFNTSQSQWKLSALLWASSWSALAVQICCSTLVKDWVQSHIVNLLLKCSCSLTDVIERTFLGTVGKRRIALKQIISKIIQMLVKFERNRHVCPGFLFIKTHCINQTRC